MSNIPFTPLPCYWLVSSILISPHSQPMDKPSPAPTSPNSDTKLTGPYQHHSPSPVFPGEHTHTYLPPGSNRQQNLAPTRSPLDRNIRGQAQNPSKAVLLPAPPFKSLVLHSWSCRKVPETKDKIARHLNEASSASPPSYMTQSSSHRRSPSSPHASKPKSSRPALHRRGTSAVSVSISKLGSGHSRGMSRSRSRGDETDFDMAASFLNFWYVFLSFPYLSVWLPCRDILSLRFCCRHCPCGCVDRIYI